MRNSRWVGSRIGLVDFWYYGDQEYEFLDGRMLLRGANGSGKSVTMQSFVPLLLDGNMRPERLDPFGSKARKMENYLLEEDDTRQERTGYLYMEFKREGSETYLTFGMGIRARKGKKLETWYFYIQDGRRVGKDFWLYKGRSEKLALTKTELRNRIGEGGSVIDSQGEYESRVNDLLFGFETVEEYRELLALLIQLRTPKLSKDFKPSIINEILSRSLQTLSEDDLRPMSEAIENMDSIETNLRTLEESAKAAADIHKVYEKYNRAVLLEKAECYLDAEQAYRKKEKETELLQRTQAKAEQDLAEETAHYQVLETELQVVEQEYHSLQESDAAKLKEQEEKLLLEEAEQSRLLEQKEQKTDSKREELRDKEIQLKSLQGEAEQLWGEIEGCFAAIEEEMEESYFPDWKFVIEDLQKEREKAYDFSFPEGLLKEYRKRIRSGMEMLKREGELKKQYGDALQEMDLRKENRDAREKEWLQYEGMVREQKGELTEAIHLWSSQNCWLCLDAPPLQQIDRQVEAFQYEDDYSDIREAADAARLETRQKILAGRAGLERELKLEEEEKKRIIWEILNLEASKEVKLEHAKEVRQNRELLKQLHIPAKPFYQAIDFDPALTDEQRNRLEASLAQMGVLDALLVPADYRERIMEIEGSVCDKYLFADAKQLQDNLMDLFTVEHEEDDILFTMQVQNILSGIGYEKADTAQDTASTWIAKNGYYKIGILEGTVSSLYTAKYIGAAARERHRQECLAEQKQELQQTEDRIAGLTAAIQEKNLHLEELQREFDAFPRVDDLKVALREANRVKHLLEQAETDVKKQLTILQGWEQQLKEIQIQVQEICGKTELPQRLDAYQQEWDSLEEYQEQFQAMKELHGQYCSRWMLIDTRNEQMEGLSLDLDDLMSEQLRMKRQLQACQASLQSIREQLQLTDYESIRERLEHCRRRLNTLDGIPKEKERSIERRSKLEKEIEYKAERLREGRQDMQQADALRRQWQTVFSREYELGYVACCLEPLQNTSLDKIQNTIPDNLQNLAARVQSLLHGQLGSKTRFSLLSDLQNAYHEKRGMLSEYQLIIQNNLFEELTHSDSAHLPSERVIRIDIKAKYRGADLPFLKLVSQLHADVDTLSSLLSEKDRELFEDILSNTISKKIRAKIHESNRWVEAMNRMMESMETSSGLTLSLKWQPKKADQEGQLDTKELVALLQTDAEIMRQEDIDKISGHFRSCIREARKLSREESNLQSFHVIMKEILDYRKWFEFQLYFQKAGEKKKELTDRMFFTFSGGEKAMSMYVPLFSAVVAKYKGANLDAPRIISLDEAFAGVDETNIKDMFRLMVQLELNFIINSQVLWGDYGTVPKLAIYHLIRPQNAKCVTVLKYIWNGKGKELQ